MNKHSLLKFALVVFISLWGMETIAQITEFTKPVIGRNHKGFYFSLAPGFNLTNVRIKYNGGSTSYRGRGGGWDFKIGGALEENLLLHATILSHAMWEPKIYDSNSGLKGEKTDEVEFFQTMIGAGVTYYTSENYLLSTSLGFGSVLLSDWKSKVETASETGFCLQLKVGKEWWISPRWGLGLAIYYNSLSTKNQQLAAADESVTGNNFGFVLNASFNGKRKG